jgi:hypothetical protein
MRLTFYTQCGVGTENKIIIRNIGSSEIKIKLLVVNNCVHDDFWKFLFTIFQLYTILLSYYHQHINLPTVGTTYYETYVSCPKSVLRYAALCCTVLHRAATSVYARYSPTVKPSSTMYTISYSTDIAKFIIDRLSMIHLHVNGFVGMNDSKCSRSLRLNVPSKARGSSR